MTFVLDLSLQDAPATPSVERARVHGNLLSALFGRKTPVLRVGRFEIRRRVGGGAQGDVYEAVDPKLGRAVAVKILRTQGRLAAREGRALARLAHPNVVEVFARGEYAVAGADPVDYVVTEFVRGDPLPVWLERDPSLRSRLEVILGCARGLLAAHRAGIVHGDFKPSNVMVGDGGRARIIDFGIAADLHAGEGARGRVEGTEGYIAPERYEGSVGPRIDQFAFAIVATEVLAPFRISTKLSNALTRARGHASSARFDTIEPLVNVLKRELEPGRRWWWVPAGAAFVAAGVGGLGSFDQAPRCRSASAEMREVWTPERKDRLAGHRDAAVIEEIGDRWIEAWDLSRIQACELGPQAAAQMRCLDGLLADFDLRISFVERNVNADEVAESLATLPTTRRCSDAAAKGVRAVSEEDERLFRRAEAEGDLAGAAAGIRLSEPLAARIQQLPAGFAARVLRRRGRWATTLDRNHDAAEWLEAAVWKADEAGDESAAAHAACALSSVMTDGFGDLEAADAWVRRTQTFAERSTDPTDDQCLLRARVTLAMDRGEFDDARALLDGAIRIAEGYDRAQLLNQRCILEESAGNPEKAISWCSAAIEAFRESLGPKHPRTLHLQQSLGAALEGAGRYQEAREILEQTIAAEDESPNGASYWTLNSLGIVLEQLEEFEGAAAAYERALKGLDDAGAAAPERRESLEVNLGTLALVQGNFTEAETRYRRSQISMEARLGPTHPRTMTPHWGIAEALEKQERYPEALEHIEHALQTGVSGGLGPALLAKPRLVKARILIHGQLDLEEGRAVARQALADVEAFAPELEETAADARALASGSM